MAIRLRRVDGVLVAVCAALTAPREGDVYLDDEQTYALALKTMWERGELADDTIEVFLMDREQGYQDAAVLVEDADRQLLALRHGKG